MTNDEFIARSIKKLQQQIDKLEKELKNKDKKLEILEKFLEYNVWHGRLEYPPDIEDQFYTRLANGRVVNTKPCDHSDSIWISDGDYLCNTCGRRINIGVDHGDPD